MEEVCSPGEENHIGGNTIPYFLKSPCEIDSTCNVERTDRFVPE